MVSGETRAAGVNARPEAIETEVVNEGAWRDGGSGAGKGGVFANEKRASSRRSPCGWKKGLEPKIVCLYISMCCG